ncbi:MAG TPA: insulinase family protein, partial [Chitinophagaceae bacterium]|nr:insulinase family protein [Chitinophagaceae bacterium]
IYKRTGKDENVVKVEKPTITPVEVNREAQSEFVTKFAATPFASIKPVFANYANDIQRANVVANGSQVPMLSVKNTTNELFSQYYYISAGSWQNKLFPIAMDYLQYLGTDKYSADEISKKFYTLACDFGVSASTEESYVYLNGLQSNYKEGVALFEHLLANCKPDQDALQNMIVGIKKKRSDSKLDKRAISSGLRYYAQYGPHNPFNNELSNADLDKLSAADLVNILHSLTSYPHSVLYYGPMASTDISKQLSSLHKLPSSFQALPKTEPLVSKSQVGNSVLFADYDMVQAEIQWVRNASMYKPEQVPLVNLFNEYFGGNMSGIVFQEIRESKALAYSTFANFGSPQKKNEPFIMRAYVGCQADKMKEAIAGMQALLTELPQSQKLFSNSTESMKNTISTSRTIKTGLLFSYLNAQKKGLDFDMNEKVYNSIGKFSLADITNFYKQEIASKPYTLTVVGSDAKMNWDALNSFGAVKKISLEEVFGY